MGSRPIRLCDCDGRAYAKLSNLRHGDVVQVDEGFTCIEGFDVRRVWIDSANNHYISCADGQHMLSGQLEPDNNTLLGIYKIDVSV